ncbi:zinc transporter-like protein [Amylocarpus encephaloides]|uniref:Zinc transporter-like protein n=1 Tax=Amylocarpus encephaloides TaxID=45428 RepID=A0A9P7Y8L4_9HELO|nr:zinc transporter-like protein [Amylocarpus encephaloides]
MGASRLSARSARILLARADECEAPSGEGGYNTGLHVAAVFIILAVSSTACAFPLLVVRVPRLRIPPTFLFVVRHFGTGVLIATAFVHLLPTAFISLTDPCLPAFWNEDYPAMAGALALAAIFLIAVIEMIFNPGKNSCAYPAAMMENSIGRKGVQGDIVASRETGEEPRESSTRPQDLGLLRGRNSSTGRELQRVTKNSAALDAIERSQTAIATNKEQDIVEAETHGHSQQRFLTENQKHKKALLQCMILEMGILFHSVFIGMALSVAIGNEFIVLLIAITFHQLFEGLALGSRIATLTWKKNAFQPWIMALAYGCTTPVGQAIGLATHNLYAPGSRVGLLMVGIMNAISAGLLTFTSLVDLMNEDFLSDDSWRDLRGRKRVVACLLVFGGAFGMSLIGAWA